MFYFDGLQNKSFYFNVLNVLRNHRESVDKVWFHGNWLAQATLLMKNKLIHFLHLYLLQKIELLSAVFDLIMHSFNNG